MQGSIISKKCVPRKRLDQKGEMSRFLSECNLEFERCPVSPGSKFTG